MKAKLRAILGLALVMCASVAFSATYYVDGENGNDSNPGSELSPWASLEYAVSEDNVNLSAGDTVIVKAGTYIADTGEGFVFKKAGVTYKADGRVFIGNSVTVGDFGGHFTWGFQIVVNDVTVEGFDISGVAGCIYLDNAAQNITIKNCVLHDTDIASDLKGDTYFPSAGVYIFNESWATVDGCTIYNIPSNGGESSGILNRAAHYKNVGDVHYSVFTRNLIYNIEGDGITCRGGGNWDRVFNNTIVDTWYGIDIAGGTQIQGSASCKNNIIVRAIYNSVWAGGAFSNTNNLIYDSADIAGIPDFAVFGANTLYVDPQFTDDQNKDYTLRDSSPAIDTGADVGYGITFNGAAPDMGCFETNVDTGPKCVVTGTVTRAAGNYFPAAPVKGAVVTCGDFSATTNASGTYRLTLPQRQVTLTASAKGADDITETVTLSSDTATVDFEFTPVEDRNVYYVAPGGDDWATGTEEDPFASIDAGDMQGILEPGDTVIVKEGTYYDEESLVGFELITEGASALAPITYKADGDVVVDMSSYMESSAQEMVAGIFVGDAELNVGGMVFDGIDFENCQFGLYLRDGFYDGVVTNCTFNNMHRPAENGNAPMASYVSGVCFSVAENCYCNHNIFSNIVDETASTVAAITMPGASNVVIANNTFDNTTTVARDWTNLSDATNPFVNNIVMNMSDTALYCSDSGLLTASYNLFDGCARTIGSGVTDAGNNFLGNAGLDADYAPIAGVSMAIDAGTDMGFAYEGSAPDLGAKESNGSAVNYAVITSGAVTDSNSNPVAGAIVTVNGSTFVSNNTGSFLSLPLRVPAGDVAVTATKNGYAEYNETLSFSGSDNALSISLTPEGTVTSAVYYVDCVNGSNSNDGSEEHPFATIQHADEAGILVPGDKVIVKAGTYSGPDRNGIQLSNCDGTEAAPITYVAEPGAVIVNNFTPSQVGDNTWGMIVSTDYTVIDGFEIHDAFALIRVLGTTGDIIENCKLHDTHYRPGYVPESTSIYIEGIGTSCIVRNCEIYNIFGPNSGSEAAGIYNMAGFDVTTAGQTPPSVYYKNLIHDVQGDGILIRGGDTRDLAYNNTIVNTLYGVDSCTWGARIHGSAIVKNNIFVNVSGNAIYANAYMDNDYNIFAASAGLYGTSYAANDIVMSSSDGIFTDLAGGDYTLAEGSPAIDSGIDLGLPYNGAAPDRGAFESGSAPVEYTDIDSLDDLNAAEDGAAVATTFDMIAVNATGAFDDGAVYGESADRLSGVKFDFSEVNLAVAVGDALKVKGIVASDADGKYIVVKEVVTKTAGDALGALGLTNANLTNNVLVRVWGKVVSAGDDTIVINKGDGDVTVKGANAAVGTFVTVTGVATETGIRATDIN